MRSGRVRAFFQEDIPAVADLYTKVFLQSRRPASSELVTYFKGVFFENPWFEDDMPSLVYEQSNGNIVGFEGVLPRRMRLLDRDIRVAIALHLMVEPESRSTLAGVQLLRSLFAGPQDVTLTDGSGMVGRETWQAAGGKTASLYSLYWTRLLRPGRTVLSWLRKRSSLRPLFWSLRPIGDIADHFLASAKPLRCTPPPNVVEQELEKGDILSNLGEICGSRSLRPHYDECKLTWLFERLTRKTVRGEFRKALVRGENGRALGWYMYYLNRGGMSQVIQIAAKKDTIGVVLNRLFFSARREGAAALSGRLDPRFVQEFSDNYCVFHRRGPWVLVQARDPGLLRDICWGDAFLTPLEGEWCALYER